MQSMEQNRFSLGSALPVPSVKELVTESLNRIPPRYIHPEQDPIFNSDAVQTLDVPVIDMQKLLSEDSISSELDKLHYACKEWGFFQLINHGVSCSLVERIKMETRDFFNLPMDEKKKKYWQQPGDLEGFGQLFVVSEEQKLEWSDIFAIKTQPVVMRNPGLFPKLPHPFVDTLDAYSSELKKLALSIIAKIGKNLKMEPTEMKDLFEEGMQSMRMNYYPPCPEPEKAIGLNPHSDSTGLTILLQLNEVEGLQIRKNGKWVPVKPLPNAFIINIGDILEILSNGTYRSIEHRAVVNSKEERISIATFYNGRFDAEVGPAPSLITEGRPARFKRVTVEEYLRGYLARVLDGKSYIDSMRINHGENWNT